MDQCRDAGAPSRPRTRRSRPAPREAGRCAAPNVFTIPPGAPFLDTLVAALLDGRLIAGFRADDPFALADVTLYLPTRRAARAIRERFLARLGRPLLLPQIRTLGDIDEDEAELLDLDAAELPPAVPAMERQLVLTRLVLAWSGALARAAAELPDEELVVPASPADAARLAASLGSLMDQVGTDAGGLARAVQGMPGRPRALLGHHAGIPEDRHRVLAGASRRARPDRSGRAPRPADPRARRSGLLAARLAGPVIAAGSTGSVPATAALLAAIARLPNGAVVLPGLDQGLDAEAWDADRHRASASRPAPAIRNTG